jgi:hypothetical protein
LGDTKNADGSHTIDHLIEAAAYAQWHRRLFARFLAERSLLRHPGHGVPVTLEEAEELSAEEGYPDGWSAAEAYAARMLPAVFQPDDPVLALTLAPEHEQGLRKLVLGLDTETFQADDALGWTYQFWRALEKDRVNKAGGKIGARELPAVTQLFTEPYMVKFLLHNTLGAWRAGKVLAARPELATDAVNEDELRAAISPPGYVFDMLRFVRHEEDAPRWEPAAGNFSGWPDTAAAIRALDPCCGSGHFLTELLAILAALRANDEGLADTEAVAAVLRDNLFGLELDGRCVQIAAFAVALAAWRIGGFQSFGPEQVHIAWIGAPPPLDRGEFLGLANGDNDLRLGLAGLHDLFVQAPLLGSLIDPTSGDLMSPQRLGRIEPLLVKLVEKTRATEPERTEGAVAARGMADAAAILSRRFTLVATNVPFLGRGKQDAILANHIEASERDAKADLATSMLSRALRLLAPNGTSASVTPQGWLFSPGYKEFRSRILSNNRFALIAPLGARAFETITGEVVNTALVAISAETPDVNSSFSILNANAGQNPTEKRQALVNFSVEHINQLSQNDNPDKRIGINSSGTTEQLSKYCYSYQGLSTGDNPRFRCRFWEISGFGPVWEPEQSTVDVASGNYGRSGAIRWEHGKGELYRFGRENVAALHNVDRRGEDAWDRRGVCISQMSDLAPTLFGGQKFDTNVAVLIPNDTEDLAAIWAFCSSPEYVKSIRAIDQSMKVTNATLVKVPFDITRWGTLAAENYPEGLPEPYSDDPTQWLFHGHPAQAQAGTQIHVALARLAGFRWPAESDPDMRMSVEAREWIAKAATLPAPDADGVLPLRAVAGERPLAERLRDYLNVAIPGWDEAKLVRETDELIDNKVSRDLSLETWLSDRACRQHSVLFQSRPFLWQVWDGQKDGFSAFLHYHRLNHATLQKLTYTLLGAWIARREAENDSRPVEAAKILQKKLEAILVGEAPYDVFVRWKSLAQQPMGWNPDLNDGVRLNIRPWVKSAVLREPTPRGITWGVDRGTDVSSAPWFSLDNGKRNNDHHWTLAQKQAAREAASRRAGAA